MSDYTLQELLQIIETEPEKAPDLSNDSDNLSEVKSFIKEKKIHSGVDRIPTHIVYYTYREVWGGNLSKIEFFRQFKTFFNQRRTGKERVYMLDGSSFDMSRDSIIMAEFHNKGKKKV